MRPTWCTRRSSASPPAPEITFRILAHPARAHLLSRITDRLPGERIEVVVNDVSPWSGMNDVLSRDLGTPHLVVLQDDSLPCENFPEAVRNVVLAAPDRLVALFHAAQPHDNIEAVRAAPARSLVELRFDRGSSWLPSVALAWPARLVRAFGSYRWLGSRQQRGDDLPLGQFARQHGGAVACVPSIVQHPDDQHSLWREKRPGFGRVPNRVAARWAEHGSPWAT